MGITERKANRTKPIGVRNGEPRLLAEQRPVLVGPAYQLFDEPLPAELQETPFAQAPVCLFRTAQAGGGNEFTAIYALALSPSQWWDLLQGAAPYKREWPYAVVTDWEMYQEKARTHAWLGDAWTDLIPHLDTFKALMQVTNTLGNDCRQVTTVFPDNYIVPISRWRFENGTRRVITEHDASPRDPQVEAFIAGVCSNLGIIYDSNRVDELAGFMVNTLLAPQERKEWKQFMNHKGEESDEKKPGFNFIGPAQVTTRALMVRQTIAGNSFYRNAEMQFAHTA